MMTEGREGNMEISRNNGDGALNTDGAASDADLIADADAVVTVAVCIRQR